MEWFKFYGKDFLSDMKMAQLSIAERLLWVTLLCLAHEEGRGGEIRYCTEDLVKSKMGLRESDQEWQELHGVFDVFERLEMIEITANGIHVKNFDKRQNTNLTPAEKMARYRSKQESGNESYRGKVTKVTPNREEKKREEKSIGTPSTKIDASIHALDDLTVIAKLQAQFPKVNVRFEMEKAKDWLEANGKRKKNYVAFARNWMRTAEQDVKTKQSSMVYCPNCGAHVLASHLKTHRCAAVVSTFAESLSASMPKV